MSRALIHLRLHGEKRWSLASSAKPGGRRPRTYWRTSIVWGRVGRRLQLRRTVRVTLAACDRRLVRLDETMRLSANELPDCPRCLVLRGMLLERGLTKPLTARRLTASMEASP